eukprot:TRINITY_DN3825_c0_g1_i2.p2 TRINITY_DN3825_c0_g1~~TRINITY_DN3825_c0_g1_i2.p2  ORF type:complete len:214 (+),score=35.05 TRINITY_DN3825_c0_g1_i2:794-1435(+)
MEPLLLNFNNVVKNGKVIGLSCGHSSNFFIFETGEIVFIGSNILYEGGLKHNNQTKDYQITINCSDVKDFVSLNCSTLMSHTDSKHLIVWGRSSSGQLGCGTDPFVVCPKHLECDLFDAKNIKSWALQDADVLSKLKWTPSKYKFFPGESQERVLFWMILSHVLNKTGIFYYRTPKPIRLKVCFYLNFFKYDLQNKKVKEDVEKGAEDDFFSF